MIPARQSGAFGGFLIAPSIVAMFILIPFCLIFGWPLNLIGWCFTTVGLSLLVPRLIAVRTWNEQVGTVIEAEDYDGGQAIKVKYLVGSQTYVASFSGELRKTVGDAVVLFVNPREPARYISLGVPLMILAVIFVVFGIAFGLSVPAYGYNWAVSKP